MPPRSNNSPRPQIPTKWLLAIVGVLLAYGLTQPTLNARFGWNLPSVAGMVADEQVPKAQRNDTVPKDNAPLGKSSDRPSQDEAKSPEKSSSADAAIATTQPDSGLAVDPNAAAESLEDYLQESAPGSEDYLSPGGLRYTRGSAEGHRLKHLSKHLEDQPSRPGKHGVFEGDLLKVLRWLDDGYERGKRGAKGTTKKTEDRRTVYEVTFDQAVGYVGGRDGKRAGNPAAKRIRLVVEGNRVITAFPF